MFHDALRDSVRDRVDLGKDIVESRNIIVPSLVESGFNLFLCQGQMLMQQVKPVMLGSVVVGLVQETGDLVRVHSPLAVLCLEILLVSGLCEFDEVDAQEDVLPQEFCKFPSCSVTIVGDEGVADVIRSLQE